jgi:hypothetical protein
MPEALPPEATNGRIIRVVKDRYTTYPIIAMLQRPARMLFIRFTHLDAP